jgi:hypothetical protein
MPRPILSFVGLVGIFALPLLLVVVIGYIPAPITPNADFFTVSIDGTPQINVSAWTLKVEGQVNHPLTFTYANFTAQPNATVVARLQCVDGPSGTAAWTGIPLNSILAMAGVKAGAIDVVFYGGDGYTSSLAWPTENKSDVLLAFAMNGEPLPPAQGFPVRVAAPNELGYKWVKWVYRIDVVDYDYKGYWESRGWSDNARIVAPTDWRLHATLLSASFLFGGLAAISGVKLSPTMTAFKNLPAIVSRKFHIAASVSFLASAVVSFAYWVTATFLARGAVFYTLHGIMGLFSIGLLVLGALKVVPNLRRSPVKSSWHGKVSLYGFIFYALTILLGLALTVGGFGLF